MPDTPSVSRAAITPQASRPRTLVTCAPFHTSHQLKQQQKSLWLSPLMGTRGGCHGNPAPGCQGRLDLHRAGAGLYPTAFGCGQVSNPSRCPTDATGAGAYTGRVLDSALSAPQLSFSMCTGPNLPQGSEIPTFGAPNPQPVELRKPHKGRDTRTESGRLPRRDPDSANSFVLKPGLGRGSPGLARIAAPTPPPPAALHLTAEGSGPGQCSPRWNRRQDSPPLPAAQVAGVLRARASQQQ